MDQEVKSKAGHIILDWISPSSGKSSDEAVKELSTLHGIGSKVSDISKQAVKSILKNYRSKGSGLEKAVLDIWEILNRESNTNPTSPIASSYTISTNTAKTSPTRPLSNVNPMSSNRLNYSSSSALTSNSKMSRKEVTDSSGLYKSLCEIVDSFLIYKYEVDIPVTGGYRYYAEFTEKSQSMKMFTYLETSTHPLTHEEIFLGVLKAFRDNYKNAALVFNIDKDTKKIVEI